MDDKIPDMNQTYRDHPPSSSEEEVTDEHNSSGGSSDLNGHVVSPEQETATGETSSQSAGFHQEMERLIVIFSRVSLVPSLSGDSSPESVQDEPIIAFGNSTHDSNIDGPSTSNGNRSNLFSSAEHTDSSNSSSLEIANYPDSDEISGSIENIENAESRSGDILNNPTGAEISGSIRNFSSADSSTVNMTSNPNSEEISGSIENIENAESRSGDILNNPTGAEISGSIRNFSSADSSTVNMTSNPNSEEISGSIKNIESSSIIKNTDNDEEMSLIENVEINECSANNFCTENNSNLIINVNYTNDGRYVVNFTNNPKLIPVFGLSDVSNALERARNWGNTLVEVRANFPTSVNDILEYIERENDKSFERKPKRLRYSLRPRMSRNDTVSINLRIPNELSSVVQDFEVGAARAIVQFIEGYPELHAVLRVELEALQYLSENCNIQ